VNPDPTSDDDDAPLAASPTWFRGPLEAYRRAISDLVDLTNVTRTALMGAKAQVGLVEALNKIDAEFDKKFDEETRALKLSRAVEQAKVAQSEISSGFRILHSNAVVLLWAYLETLVDDLLLATIINNPEFHTLADWGGIRAPVAEFSILPKEEQALFLASAATQHLRQRTSAGNAQIETILEFAGLGGARPEGLDSGLYLMNKVRNLIAHRAGVVDAKFVRECPQVEAAVGTRLTIGTHTFSTCALIAIQYHQEVRSRCEIAYQLSDPIKAEVVGPFDLCSALNTDSRRIAAGDLSLHGRLDVTPSDESTG